MSIISRKTTLHLAPVAAEALPAGQFGPVPAPLLAWTATITSVTWKSASGGDWSTAADWSGGKVPTASNSATIAAAGTYTVTISTADTAYSLLVNNKNVTVSDSSSLSVSGALTVTAGVFSLADGASITGGTLSTGANGSFYFNQSDGTDSDYASVLNGVTYQGTLNLGGGNEGLAIGGTLTMQGASGTGGGVINLSGTNDYLYVTAYESTPTLANGVMDIGSTVNTATGGANIEFTDTAYNTVSETLTIASNFDIAQSGAYAIIDKANPYTTYGYTTSIYNAGTITADISGGYFDVGYTNAIDSFTNVGSIVVSNGDNLGIDANATYNTGTITVNNASISIANLSATSGGTVLLTNGASAYLYGNYTLSAVQSVSGGVVDLGGTLTNTGTLLTSNGYYFQDATVDGGVIQDATGAQTFADVNYYGFSYIHATSLNSVTYQGTLNLAGGNSALEIGGTLTMQGGNGTGGGVINLTAQSDYLFITDSENTPTLANGVMNIGSSVDTATGGANIEFTDSGTQNLSETLTIASNFDIVQSGTYAFIDKANSYYGYSYATSIYNAGTITAGVSGGVFYIGVTNVIDSFTNAGSIAVSNSDALGINANATYNTGTITVNDASVSIENLYASAGGTVLLTNGASAYLYGNYTLSAVQSVSGGVVDLGGTLTNTGTLLTSNGYYLQYATVDGGVIQDATGAQTFADVNYYGFSYIDATSLNSVTYQGTLNLAGGNSALVIGGTLTMQGGNGTGGGVINLTAQSDYLFITDSENTPTLANGVMNIGSSVDAATGGANIEFTDSGTQNLSETLTIASNFDIVQSGTYAIIDKANSYYGYSYATSIYNAGTITAGVSGGGFYIGDTNAIDSFTNAGSIAVSNSDYLGINANATYNTGTITVNDASVGIDNLTASAGGTVLLTNGASAYLYGNYTLSAVQSVSGGVVDLGGTLTNTGTLLTSNGYYLQYATVDGGVIQDATGAQTFADVNYYGFSYIDATSLNSVTYRGTLNLTGGNSALVIGGTLTMQGGAGTGGGVINLTGQSDYLFITDSENTPTLANGVMNIGSSVGAATGGANIEFTDSGTQNLSETLTIASNFDIVQSGTYAIIDKANSYYGYGYTTSIYNAGTITASVAGGGFYIGDTNAIDSFTNTGTIAVSNGDYLSVDASAFTNLNNEILGGGTYVVSSGSTFQMVVNSSVVSSFTIATDASNITLGGAGSQLEIYSDGTSSEYTLDSTLATISTMGTLNILGGRAFTGTKAFADNGLLTLGGGKFSESSLRVGTGAKISGFGTLATNVSNSGVIEAKGGTLILSGAVSGTGTLQIDNGGTLSLASTDAENVTFTGINAGLAVTKTPGSFTGTLAGFGPGDSLGFGTMGVASAAFAGSTLAVTFTGSTTQTYALAAAAAANERLGLSSNGDTVTAYRYAAASTHTPEPVAFGNHHVGDVVSTALSITNTAAADGYSEALDASIGGGTGGVTGVNGSFTGLVAGATNNSSLTVGLNTSSTGSKSGTATISLFTDGTGIDGDAALSIGTQTVNVSGAVYAYAKASLANNGTVTLANAHVGQAVSGQLVVTNSAAVGNYSEALDVSITPSSPFTGVGSLSAVAAGSSGTLSVGYSGGGAGVYSGTETLALVSDGTAIGDGLGTTTLASQLVTVTGASYAYASPSLASSSVNLGVVHVGQADSAALTLTNGAAAGGYSEALDAGLGGASAGVTTSGTVSGLAAGAVDMSSLLVGLATSTSGSFSGTALLSLASDGNAINDGLGTTSLGSQTITVSGIVDNYASAAFQDPGGPAITGSGTQYSVSLGAVVQGSAAEVLSLGVLNAATGLSDLLQGTISSAGGSGFTNGGFGAFSGLGAGQGEHSQSVTLATSTAGTFTETILLSSAGTNASGYDGALATETLTVTGVITPVGSTSYTLSAGPNTINGANGGDLFVAPTYSLNSRDSLTGGTGANVIQLSGGGQFDLGAPKVFANIPTVTAYEGQTASGTVASTQQVVFLRDSSNETVNVVAGTAAKGDTNPESIIIYSSAATNTINLASGSDQVFLATGNDTVVLGGAKNSVVAGGGTALVQSLAANASASVVGTTTGSTVLQITNAGTVSLNAADTDLTVQLLGATKLTLDKLQFITANGGNGGDTIIAGAANQTLIGGAADVLTGYSGGSDLFSGATAALNGDTIGDWTTGDAIDLTDMSTSATLSYAGNTKSGKLTVSSGSLKAVISFTGDYTLSNFARPVSDGHGGALIAYAA